MAPPEIDAAPVESEEAPAGESLYARLKPGRGRTTDEVFASQWARLRRAMIELCAERGYEAVTLRDLTRLAGVSTRTFYKHFPNAEECFAYTYESLMHDGLRRAHGAQRGNVTWEQALRASLRSLLEDLADEPKVAKLLLVEAFALGPGMQLRMREAVAGFERLLNDSLAGDPRAPAFSHHILSGIAAGVTRVMRTRLPAAESADLDQIDAELGDWVLSLVRGYAEVWELPDASSTPSMPGPQNGEVSVPAILGGMGDERERILSATIKLASSGGLENLTFPQIRAEAGVSRRCLDARFVDVGDCFLEAIEAMAAAAAARAQRKALRASDFAMGTDLAITALCTEAARNPLLARLAFVDIFSPGREGFLRRERLVSLGAAWLRRAAPPDCRPSELLAEASVAAAWRIAHTEIAPGTPGNLPRLAPTLSHVLLASATHAAADPSAAQLGEPR